MTIKHVCTDSTITRRPHNIHRFLRSLTWTKPKPGLGKGVPVPLPVTALY